MRHLGAILTALLVAEAAQGQELNPTQGEVSAFTSADRNGDGVLVYPEFRTFIRLMAAQGQPTARQVRFFNAYRYAFSVTDADRSGYVTPWELRRSDENFRAGGG